MASGDNEVRMMMSVYPGAMTGFAAMNAGLSSILNVFNGMTRAFDQQFGLVDAALTTTSVVVTQLGVDAMNAFGQFEQGMKIVQMVSNQTSQDMDILKQKANEFSVEYRMDIDQITEGLQTLGRAGLNSATEQAEVLENGLYTAKLEGRDLNSVLQELLQNTTLLGGDLKSSDFGEQSQYVNDLLVATSMTAPITTHDISETLKYSGGIAAAAGAKIDTDEGKAILEDYMGAIAAFAQKGVSGSIAGTALRAFLNKPATQDSSVVDALASIKLKPEYLWEEGGEVMKPISEQIGLIKGQMEELNISTMDQLQIWSKIVGGKMGQQMMKLDSEDIKEVSKDIQAADSASNLAAGSMKTYEANIKQVRENAAELQREVGEKLVFFANPWIEIINKVLDFFNMDFMSVPLTGGVIAFVGYLFTQIRRIASTIKSEISNLLGLTRDARALMHQSMTGRAQMDEKEIGSFVAMKKDSSKQAIQIAKAEAGQAAAEGFKEFTTQYNKQLAAVSKLSYGALVDAGVTGDRMGVIASLQKITKTDKFGLKPQDYVAAGMVTGTLPKGMEEELIKARKSGLTGRPLLDNVIGKDGSKELNAFMAHIRTSSENLKLLGISAEEATAKLSGTSTSGKFKYGSWHDSERRARTMGLIENRVASQEAAAESAAIKGAEAHATALGNETKATEQNVVAQEEVARTVVDTSETITTNVKVTAAAVTEEFIQLARNIKNFAAIPTGQNKYINYTPMPSGYFGPIPSGFNTVPLSGRTLGGQESFILQSSRTTPIEERNPVFYSDKVVDNIVKPVSNRIDKIGTDITRTIVRDTIFADTRLNNLRNYNTGSQHIIPSIHDSSLSLRDNYNSKTQHDISALHLGEDASVLYKSGNKSIAPIGPIPFGLQGVGSLQGLYTLFAQLQVEFQKELEQKMSQMHEDASIHKEEASIKKEEIAKINQDITAKQAEIDSAYAEAEAAERAALALQNFSNMFGSGGRALQKVSTDPHGFFNIGLTDKQKQDLRAMNHAANQRGLRISRDISTARDKAAFEKEKSNLITSRNEINDIRNKAKQQYNDLKETKNKIRYQTEQGKSSQITYRNADAKLINSQLLGTHANQLDSIRKQHQLSGNEILNTHKDVLKRVQSNPIVMQNYAGNMGIAGGVTEKEKQALYGGVWGSIKQRWESNRAGRFNFGTVQTAQGLKSVTTGLRGMGNGLLNLTDMIGGTTMMAFMAIPALINMWKGAFEGFCNDLKEVGNKLNEAYSNWNSAEDSLRQSYRNKNPDATDEEIDQMVLDTYSTMGHDIANAVNKGSEEWFKKINTDAAKTPTYEYDKEKDDGTVKEVEEEVDKATALEDAIKQNTGALYQATAELSAAMTKYVQKGTDSWWGISGWTGQLTDILGKISDFTEKFGILNILSPINTAIKGLEDYQGGLYADNRFYSNASKFTDSNEFLLTARQKDENYAGYTEMAGLMLQDFKDAKGDYLAGLQTMMGTDAITFNNVISQTARDWLDTQAKFASRLTQADNLRLQTSMKNDSKTWKSLAKEVVKQESKTGKKVTPKNMTKKIEGLISKLNASMNGAFDETQLLQAANMEIMQGMFEVAKSIIVPIISANAQTAAQTLVSSDNIYNQTNGTGTNSANITSITSAIAAMVSQIAMAQAAEATYNAILMQDPNKLKGGDLAAYELAQSSSDANDFLKKASQASYKGASVNLDSGAAIGNFVSGWSKGGVFTSEGKADLNKISEAWKYYSAQDNQKAMNDILRTFGISARMTTYGEDALTAGKKIDKAIAEWRENGSSSQLIYESLSHIYQDPKFRKQLENAYLSAGDEGGGSSGGSGSGSGSKNKDKDQGTKKERVDLVLCNKKEIPKLNVNLFKKAPSFTILNKNFKLRDIKVNTQDKPKAVLASIKNAIIDVQKRTDPKIIQDEEAIYDPVGATDGNTPSGTSDVRTNTG